MTFSTKMPSRCLQDASLIMWKLLLLWTSKQVTINSTRSINESSQKDQFIHTLKLHKTKQNTIHKLFNVTYHSSAQKPHWNHKHNNTSNNTKIIITTILCATLHYMITTNNKYRHFLSLCIMYIYLVKRCTTHTSYSLNSSHTPLSYKPTQAFA